jgi:hypothetical protein
MEDDCFKHGMIYLYADMGRRNEPQDKGPRQDTAVINSQGGGGNQFHNVVTMYTLYHEAIFRKFVLCVSDLLKTHACFWASFPILPCRSDFLIEGRYGW